MQERTTKQDTFLLFRSIERQIHNCHMLQPNYLFVRRDVHLMNAPGYYAQWTVLHVRKPNC